MKVRVFTDGACSKNGQQGAKASYAYYFPDHKEYSNAARVPETQSQTNNRGELMAILESVKVAKEKFNPEEIELIIYTDSQYAKNCLTQWLIGWVQNNWKKASGEDVKNRDLIEETTDLLRSFTYQIKHVPAHTGKTDEISKCNEIVDRMAVAVIDPEVASVKIIHTNNQEKPIEGFPVELMGPPVSAGIILRWCKENLEKLDEEALNNAIMSVVSKTLKKKGFDLEKQRLHRTAQYRLVSSHLIAENTHIIKEE